MADSTDWEPFTFEGRECWRMDASVLVPIGDPQTEGGRQTGAAVFIIAPPQGRAAITGMAKGDPGEPPDLTGPVTVVEIEHDDPAAPEWDWDIITPATDSSPAVWGLTVEQRKGPPGDPADVASTDLTDLYGTGTEGWVPAWSTNANGAGGDGLVYTPMGHGGQYWPTSIPNTTGSNGQLRTIAQASVPALPFAWRPRVFGYSIIGGTVNTRPSLYARVGTTSGDIVGSDVAVPGIATQKLTLQSGVPAGSASNYGVIAANSGPTTIFLRAEEQASTVDNYTTSNTTTTFYVEAEKVI